MYRFGSEADDSFTIRYVWRGNRWVAEAERRRDFWPTVAEWAALTCAACLIMLSGAVAGFLSAKPELDVESRAFASTVLNDAAANWSPQALIVRASPDVAWRDGDAYGALLGALKGEGRSAKVGGCRGGTQISLFSLRGLVTARYLCALKLPDRTAVAAVSLRDEPDAWKITGFYVEP